MGSKAEPQLSQKASPGITGAPHTGQTVDVPPAAGIAPTPGSAV